MVDIFCTYCQQPHMDQRERLHHVPLGLPYWEEDFAGTPWVLVSGVLDMAVQLISTLYTFTQNLTPSGILLPPVQVHLFSC